MDRPGLDFETLLLLSFTTPATSDLLAPWAVRAGLRLALEYQRDAPVLTLPYGPSASSPASGAQDSAPLVPSLIVSAGSTGPGSPAEPVRIRMPVNQRGYLMALNNLGWRLHRAGREADARGVRGEAQKMASAMIGGMEKTAPGSAWQNAGVLSEAADIMVDETIDGGEGKRLPARRTEASRWSAPAPGAVCAAAR
ncbi:hypothetical protein ACFXG6_25295 [Streptomyces roseus]|uniref:hypothetical protein n=1 Tax=Streptomyces roseus TaxID=66430 RepID=UPI0036C630D5